MKKLLTSCLFVLSGSLLWWGLSNTARLSVKKWDAKFESVLRHGLSEVGIDNEDLLSSVNELKNDANGEYVMHRMSVRKASPEKINEVIHELEESGADVLRSDTKAKTTLFVKRGSRIYQEVTFKK